VNKYKDIVVPDQHHHLANKYEVIVNLQVWYGMVWYGMVY